MKDHNIYCTNLIHTLPPPIHTPLYIMVQVQGILTCGCRFNERLKVKTESVFVYYRFSVYGVGDGDHNVGVTSKLVGTGGELELVGDLQIGITGHVIGGVVILEKDSKWLEVDYIILSIILTY